MQLAMTDKTIFRTEKNADNPFVMIDRRPVENPMLSWRAKGILAYLISRPDNWIVRLGDLVKRSTDGLYAVRAALKELTEAGHITRFEERDNGKFKQYVLLVHELPVTRPPTNLSQAVKPQAVNHTLNDTERDNENKLNTPSGSSENPSDRKLDLVDYELSKLPIIQVKHAVKEYFRINVNWDTKTARQWLEWAKQEGVTPEQIKTAADKWRTDKTFSWQKRTIQNIYEQWELLKSPAGELSNTRRVPNLERG